MKFAFVCRVFENYAYEIFSTILKKKGHTVKLFYDAGLFQDYSINNTYLANIFSENNNLLKNITCYKPDYIFFSIYTDNLIWSLNFSRKIKKNLKNSIIIFGGPHITITGDEIIKKYDFIDYAVRGAGEKAVQDISDNNLNQNTTGLIYRKDNKIINNNWEVITHENFINILPDRSIFIEKLPFLKKYYSTFSGFGCPYSCSFCIHSTLKQLKKYSFIKKNIKDLIIELKKAKSNGSKKIIFHDDVFTINKNWLLKFLRQYRKEINLPFMCISHPLLIDNKIAIELKKSKCVNIEIGTQIMNNKIKKIMLNRNETDEEVKKCLKILKKNKIPVTVDHILGIPGETIKDHLKSLIIYKKASVSRIILSYLTAYPGILINKKLIDKNIISNKKLKKIRNGFVDNFMNYGSINTDKDIIRTELLFEWLPYIPKKTLKFILKTQLYKKILENKIISKYIPFSIKIFSKNEYNLEIYIKRYIYYIKQKLQSVGFRH